MNHYSSQQWLKPEHPDGCSRHGYYFSYENAEQDKYHATVQAYARASGTYNIMRGKHADFHVKMDSPPRGVTVD